MEAAPVRKPWYRKLRYQILVVMIAVILVLSFLPVFYNPPASPLQVRLNRTVDYFARNYDVTVGLIPETPGSPRFWLYSDNYLAALALSRYDPGNSSTASFASALETAVGGYAATMPSGLLLSQYTALNSTKASFSCSADYTLTWSPAGTPPPSGGSATIMSASNDQSPACASQDYADLLFLQAIYYHRLGNSSAAASYFDQAAKDYDGSGFADLAYTTPSSQSYHVYQTYKLALYVYAAYCLGVQAKSSGIPSATGVLLYMQSNSTDGFASGYAPNLTSLSAPPLSPTGSVNTETTAMAALALELMIRPTGTC